MNEYRKYQHDLQLCVRSMLYVSKNMSEDEAIRECRRYIELSRKLYGRRV